MLDLGQNLSVALRNVNYWMQRIPAVAVDEIPTLENVDVDCETTFAINEPADPA